MTTGLVDELSLEDRINDEVRVILEAIQEDMRKGGVSYPEMFKKVEDEARAPVQGGAMRISRDKLNKLAHTVADTLAEVPECDFPGGPEHDSPGSSEDP